MNVVHSPLTASRSNRACVATHTHQPKQHWHAGCLEVGARPLPPTPAPRPQTHRSLHTLSHRAFPATFSLRLGHVLSCSSTPPMFAQAPGPFARRGAVGPAAVGCERRRRGVHAWRHLSPHWHYPSGSGEYNRRESSHCELFSRLERLAANAGYSTRHYNEVAARKMLQIPPLC